MNKAQGKAVQEILAAIRGGIEAAGFSVVHTKVTEDAPQRGMTAFELRATHPAQAEQYGYGIAFAAARLETEARYPKQTAQRAQKAAQHYAETGEIR